MCFPVDGRYENGKPVALPHHVSQERAKSLGINFLPLELRREGKGREERKKIFFNMFRSLFVKEKRKF